MVRPLQEWHAEGPVPSIRGQTYAKNSEYIQPASVRHTEVISSDFRMINLRGSAEDYSRQSPLDARLALGLSGDLASTVGNIQQRSRLPGIACTEASTCNFAHAVGEIFQPIFQPTKYDPRTGKILPVAVVALRQTSVHPRRKRSRVLRTRSPTRWLVGTATGSADFQPILSANAPIQEQSGHAA